MNVQTYFKRLGKLYMIFAKMVLIFIAAFIVMIASIVKGIGFGVFLTIFIFGSYFIIKKVWKVSRKIAMDKSSQL